MNDDDDALPQFSDSFFDESTGELDGLSDADTSNPLHSTSDTNTFNTPTKGIRIASWNINRLEHKLDQVKSYLGPYYKAHLQGLPRSCICDKSRHGVFHPCTYNRYF